MTEDYNSSDSESDFDGHKTNPIINTVMKKYRHEKLYEEKKLWHKRFPSGHFTKFVRDGLIPHMTACGYKSKVNFQTLVRSVYHWAWCVMRVVTKEYGKYIHYKKPSHGGYDEDFIWFCQKVESEEYTQMLYMWQFRQFFDDSPIGQKHHHEFIHFLWSIVDLEGSKGHAIARQMLDDENEEESNEKKNLDDIRKQPFDKHGF